jgi:glutamate dehydrogenase/leucine dehydrogenase
LFQSYISLSVLYGTCKTPTNPTTTMASKRVEQIAAHLNYPKGMLAGQVAIITGSGQGIGAEAARLFANEGAKVVVSDIDGSKLDKVGLTNLNSRLTTIPLHRESTAGRRQHQLLWRQRRSHPR